MNFLRDSRWTPFSVGRSRCIELSFQFHREAQGAAPGAALPGQLCPSWSCRLPVFPGVPAVLRTLPPCLVSVGSVSAGHASRPPWLPSCCGLCVWTPFRVVLGSCRCCSADGRFPGPSSPLWSARAAHRSSFSRRLLGKARGKWCSERVQWRRSSLSSSFFKNFV